VALDRRSRSGRGREEKEMERGGEESLRFKRQPFLLPTSQYQSSSP